MNEGDSSEAAFYNARVLRRIQKALERDPEVDITTVLPKAYLSQLARRKVVKPETTVPTPPETSQHDLPILLPSQPAHIVHPLSHTTKAILGFPTEDSTVSGTDLTRVLAHTLSSSEIIWRAKSSMYRYVVRCGDQLAIKCVKNNQNFTGYTCLQFLEKHMPEVPAPRSHGLVASGEYAWIITSFVPGAILADIWDTLGWE